MGLRATRARVEVFMYRRVISVLIFATTAAALLIRFPGPAFSTVSNIKPKFSPTFADTMPMVFDDAQTIELRIQAKSAMDALLDKHSQSIVTDNKSAP
jgi:hypothetical protein